MRPRSTASAALPLALVLALGLSACSAVDADSRSSEPTSAGSNAPSFDPTGATSSSEAARTVDPGWDTAVQEADGTFLSMHEHEDSLEYRAVDSAGEVLWTAQRPRACSAYLVAAASDGPIAVLMDQDSSTGDSLTPTASAYDLATGEKRWGPVETPGALLGNGLVFAGPPKDFIGTGGPRTALDPSTGDVVASEGEDRSGTGTDDESEASGVIALFGEHLVRSHGSDILGESFDGRRLWTRAAEDLGMSASEAREAPWEPVGTTHALLGDAGTETRSLIDLRSGDIVDSEISDAWFDSSSDTLITIGSHLRGFDDDGSTRWSTSLPESAEVTAAGAGLVTVESEARSDAENGTGTDTGSGSSSRSDSEQTVTARSARDGSPVADDTPLLGTLKRVGAPHHISESGAALIGDPQAPLLVTNQE